VVPHDDDAVDDAELAGPRAYQRLEPDI
jgi:hypothetical protein